MGLSRRLRHPDDSTTEERFLRPENELPLMGGMFTPSRITPLAALAIADVWAAVRVLADAASSLPLHVYRTTAGNGRELVTSGRLVDLLTSPAPSVTQADLVSTLMAHVLVWGNAFLAKFRDGAGTIVQLVPLHPDLVQPEIVNGDVQWWYSPRYSGDRQRLTQADVVHIRGLSVDSVLGLSPVTQACNVLGLSDELVRHALSYFDTGDPTTGTGSARGVARPAGILNLGPDATAAQGMREREQLRNVSRPHGILVLAGEATYTPIASKLDDSQFVEQRRLAAQEIARVFNIPRIGSWRRLRTR